MPGKFRSSFPPGGLKPARRRTSGRLRKNQRFPAPSGAAGYYASLLQRLLLVRGDPKSFQGSGDLPLSASDNMNIIMAVNQGADDFVPSPLIWGILTAKIQALLRRTYDYGIQTEILEHRGAVLNTGDATLRYEGRVLELTKNEYRILRTLMESRGKVVSRERLMERLWETDSYVDENTLSVNVNRLRKKLDGAGLTGFITTKIGMGYLIE